MQTLASHEQLDQLLTNGKTILVFSADWCPDCRVIEPIFPELEEEFSEWTFVYVDRDDYIDICQQYDVFGIPSFIAFKDGEEKGRFVSKNRKTKEEIVEFLKKAES